MESNKKSIILNQFKHNGATNNKRSVSSIFNSIVNLSLSNSTNNGGKQDNLSTKKDIHVINQPNQYLTASEISNEKFNSHTPITQMSRINSKSKHSSQNLMLSSKSSILLPSPKNSTIQGDKNISPVLPNLQNNDDNLRELKPINKSIVFKNEYMVPQSTNTSAITLQKNLETMLSITTTAAEIHEKDNHFRSKFPSDSPAHLNNNTTLLTHFNYGHFKSKSFEEYKSSNEKKRTPDWINEIFVLAKKGKLIELKNELLGLEPTLVKHLVDSKGNTLLHVSARRNQLEILKWFVKLLTEAALNDKNQVGQTVLMASLKSRQLECFQWLVLNTNCGVSLAPEDGKDSLLHYAAAYDNLVASRWLIEQLRLVNATTVDIRNASGLTPLHIAAQNGHLSISHHLITSGGDPTCQTDGGFRPLHLAIRNRHLECANYLLMAEAAASLAIDHEKLSLQIVQLYQTNQLLQNKLREILEMSKLLLRDRTDMIKNFARSDRSDGTLLLDSVDVSPSLNEIYHSEMETKLNMFEELCEKKSMKSNGESLRNEKLSPVLLRLGGEALNPESQPSVFTLGNILQKRLADLHLESRRGENFVVESSRNSTPSSLETDDDDNENRKYTTEMEQKEDIHQNEKEKFLPDNFLQGASLHKTYPSIHTPHGHVPIKSSPVVVSKTTKLPPWVLPTDDFILKSNLTKPQKKFQNLHNDLLIRSTTSSSSESSSSIQGEAHLYSSVTSVSSQFHELPKCKNTHIAVGREPCLNVEQILSRSSSSPSVAVLEVIEPSDNKKIYHNPAPAVIRATFPHIQNESTTQDNECNEGGRDLKEIYEGIKGVPSNEFLQIEENSNTTVEHSSFNRIPLAKSSVPMSVSSELSPISSSEDWSKSSPSHVLNVSSLPENNDKNFWSRKSSHDFHSFTVSTVVPTSSSSFPLSNTLMIPSLKNKTRSKDTTNTLIQEESSHLSLESFPKKNKESEERINSPTFSETSQTESATGGDEDRIMHHQHHRSEEGDEDVPVCIETGDLLLDKILSEEDSLQVNVKELQGTNDFYTSREEQIEKNQRCEENNKRGVLGGMAMDSDRQKQSTHGHHGHHKLFTHTRSKSKNRQTPSRRKPWYEVEGSDEDEEALILRNRPSSSQISNPDSQETKTSQDLTTISLLLNKKCDTKSVTEDCPEYI